MSAPVVDDTAMLAEMLTDNGSPLTRVSVISKSAPLMAARLAISFAPVNRVRRT